MTPWHILADDLTGALDTAAAWAQAGPVPVFLDTPTEAPEPVQVVATGTRAIDTATLGQRLQPCLDWLCASGHAFKKIDSLLRGNTFAEIAWLLHHGPFAGAVFAPAFPAQGRFTAQGRHWVGPPFQPTGPRGYEHPLSLEESFREYGLNAHLHPRIPDQLPAEGGVFIPTVLSDHELDRLALLAASPQGRDWLWCGSAGLAGALARQDDVKVGRPPPMPQASASDERPPLVLSASRHPVLRDQLHHLALLDAPIDLVDLAERDPLSTAQAQALLDQRMQTVVAHHARPGTLVVVGGDTLLALCRAAGVRSLLAGSSPRAGWGRARLIGGVWDGVCCYSRSGAFGPPDDLRELLAALTSSRFTVKEQHRA